MFFKVLTREVSGHSPVVLNLGLNQQKVERRFNFELCWFLRDDLVEVISKVWHIYFPSRDCASKPRKLRKYLKGWNLNYVFLVEINL